MEEDGSNPVHSLGFLFLLEFSDLKENPQNPSAMQKLADNFSITQCLWKTFTLYLVFCFDN